MAENEEKAFTRRSFLGTSVAAGTAGSAFTIVRPELVRGAGKERLRAGLVGCGGRGTEAAVDLLTADPEVELVAMGDVFEDKLEASLANLRDPQFLAGAAGSPKNAARFTGKPLGDLVESIRARVKVDQEHRFSSFTAFRKVLASDIDVVLLCTPPGYRPEHFEAAVNAGKHIFTEKPIATDAVGVRQGWTSCFSIVVHAAAYFYCGSAGQSIPARAAVGRTSSPLFRFGAFGRNSHGCIRHTCDAMEADSGAGGHYRGPTTAGLSAGDDSASSISLSI